MTLDAMAEIAAEVERNGKPFWQVVRDCDAEENQITAEESRTRMLRTWQAMLNSVEQYSPERRSVSGLSGGDGARMCTYIETAQPLCGEYLQEVIATALCVGESNACMRTIVAAPTAGSCGVLPAVLVPLFRRGQVTEEEILQSLYVAAGIGVVIGHRATLAGAEGGCQAEIGAASAMAAGALVSLKGGDCRQIGHAAAMALKNLMGLICDPVAGLVDVPCVKRNVVGAVNAISCADMALAGIESRVPVDQVIDCMGDVGRRLPAELRETALGGLAATPFGREVRERLQREERSDSSQSI